MDQFTLAMSNIYLAYISYNLSHNLSIYNLSIIYQSDASYNLSQTLISQPDDKVFAPAYGLPESKEKLDWRKLWHFLRPNCQAGTRIICLPPKSPLFEGWEGREN